MRKEKKPKPNIKKKEKTDTNNSLGKLVHNSFNIS